ncbi:MAG: hypothetical protein CMH34_09965 [Microbacterium sp.]|nr:hypothetical protein [Microbacterium sp.]
MAAPGRLNHPLEASEPLLEEQITRRFLNIAHFWPGYTLPVLLDQIEYHHWEGIAMQCDKAAEESKRANRKRAHRAARPRRRG